MKRRGITPMTARSAPSKRNVRPTTVVAAEVALPEAIAEDRDRRRSRAPLGGGARPMSGGTPITSKVFIVT